LGHLTRKIVSEMTYNVSSGTLNTTIPYHTCFVIYFTLDLSPSCDLHIGHSSSSSHLCPLPWDRQSSHAVSICSVSAVHILQSISCMVNLDFSFIGNLVHCLCPLMGSSMHCTLSNKHSLLFLTVAYKISCLVVSSISSCPVVSSISCSVVSITVSFLTLSFDVVLDSFLRQLWWKGFTSVINHVSALYDSHSLILTGSRRLFGSQMQFGLLKAKFAFNACFDFSVIVTGVG